MITEYEKRGNNNVNVMSKAGLFSISIIQPDEEGNHCSKKGISLAHPAFGRDVQYPVFIYATMPSSVLLATDSAGADSLPLKLRRAQGSIGYFHCETQP